MAVRGTVWFLSFSYANFHPMEAAFWLPVPLGVNIGRQRKAEKGLLYGKGRNSAVIVLPGGGRADVAECCSQFQTVPKQTFPPPLPIHLFN